VVHISTRPATGVDFAASAAWWMATTRPERVTLEHVLVVFWGWHKLSGQQWRYFSALPNMNNVLSKIEVAV
jgi:hypothetical protein